MPEGSAVLRYSRGLPHSRQLGERLRFLVLSGGDKGTCFSAIGNVIFIGLEGCQIVLNDSNISRKHAELLWKEGHYWIRDLGSSNGVVINGRKTPEAKLTAGDIVLIGLTVLQVYLPGQRLNTVKQAKIEPPKKAKAAASPEVAHKRMYMMLALSFAGALAYLSGGQDTMHTPPPTSIEEESPSNHPDEKAAEKVPTLKEANTYIEKMRLNLGKAEAIKASLEEQQRVRLATLSRGHFVETESESEASRQQREDADVFFHTGVREAQNKNYRRAIMAYNTALIVDPRHDLAKMYLATAKASMLVELRSMEVAGFRAKSALRLKEARMNFQNIERYLETDNDGTVVLTSQTKHDLDELLREAKEELAELNQLEGKRK